MDTYITIIIKLSFYMTIERDTYKTIIKQTKMILIFISTKIVLKHRKNLSKKIKLVYFILNEIYNLFYCFKTI